MCKDYIAARGPDCLNKIHVDVSEQWQCYLCASVLWMQGLRPISQPLVDSDKNVLLWNGDVFTGSMVIAFLIISV